MEQPEKKVRETTMRAGNTTETTQETINHRQSSTHQQNVIARLVSFLVGVLLVFLGLRLILVLLGANPANSFANFIFTTSHPFVAPFFSLFGYSLKYGVSRFETFTLVAMVVYALIGYGVIKLITITQD